MSDEPRQHEPNVPPPGAPGPGGEELDALLRQWHRQNAERAVAGRESLMARLRAEERAPAGASMKLDLPPLIDDEMAASLRDHEKPAARPGPVVVVLRRLSMHRVWTAAAAAIILAGTLPLIMLNRGGGLSNPTGAASQGGGAKVELASYDGYIMCPEGGRLDARDAEGNLLGPCALKHTDVTVDVSGFLTRVTLTQKYHNPHRDKIEALYTFPLSERSAVDRMTMTVGNRVIEGQVKEKGEARRIYEQAKAEGRIASLLEQQRPNIFTQTIANIEPGAEIDITISYVETTKQVGGVFEFDFPTTITPRFIPGNPITGDTPSPPPRPDVIRRNGLVLLAPAAISDMRAGDTGTRGALSESQVSEMLRRAVPIRGTTPTAPPSATIWYTFRAAYQDGSAEYATLYTDGLGTINGRAFAIPENAMPGNAPAYRAYPPIERGPDANAPGAASQPGAPSSPDTDRVPDASKITPMPVMPGTRAGHDISITVNIDTGGPALGMVTSELHEVVTSKAGGRATVTLKNNADIPNRDFVLKWRQESREVEPAVFTCAAPQGNFFAVQMTPPPAITDDEVAAIAVPREMVFVLDISGSMKGRPIEKAKEVLDKALATLRPSDTFNIIKFENTLSTLWSAARPATPENLVQARSFYMQQLGQGGTQMLSAIQAAYRAGGPDAPDVSVQSGISPLQLANLPADGRRVLVDADLNTVHVVDDGKAALHRGLIRVNDQVSVDLRMAPLPTRPRADASGSVCRLTGTWQTLDGNRVLVVESSSVERGAGQPAADPFRVIVFITDGQIGNDNEVIAEIQARHGRAAIFPFAIGNGPNRYLLDSMARFGRGEVEYVYDSTNADEVIARFSRRLQTPVLTNIKVEFSPNLNVLDVMTALGGGGGSVAAIDAIPDLFDVKPLTIVGRYNQPARGTVTISGMTVAGPYRRVIDLDLPAPLAAEQMKALEDVRLNSARAEAGAPDNVRQNMRRDTIATLWARAKVEAVTGEDLRGVLAGNMRPELKSQIVTLGETFSLVTPYTSFVAVDRLRITVAGKPRLVHIPIELTAGTDPSGFFGGWGTPLKNLDDDMALLGSEGELSWYSDGSATAAGNERIFSFSLDLPFDRKDEPTAGVAPYGVEQMDDLAAATTLTDLSSAAAPKKADERPYQRAKPSARPSAASAAGQGGVAGEKTKEESQGDKSGTLVVRGDSAVGAPPSPPTPSRPQSPAGSERREDATKDAQTKKEYLDSAGRQAGASAPASPGARVSESEALSKLSSDEDLAGGFQTRRLKVAANSRDSASATPDWSDSTFFGYVQQHDPGAAAQRQQWQLSGINEAQAPDAARVLGLYFTPTQPAAATEFDRAPSPSTTKSQAGAPAPVEAPPARQRVVLAEHVLIRIGKLVHEGKLEQAAALAGALSDALPGVGAATEVKRVLTDASIAGDERTRVIDEQAKAAGERLEMMLRNAKLRQRLAPELFAPAVTQEGPFPEKAVIIDGGILLSILVTEANDITRDALNRAGLRVESVDVQTRVIVGVAPLSKLGDIGVVDGVRKVEATRE